MKKIRSKHGNVFNYFACDHKDLSPAYVRSCEKFFNSLEPQAASDKPQAASNKRLDKVKQIQDNRGYKQKEKYGKHNKTNTTNE